MIKYVFNVYHRESGDKISQVITSCDHMLDTLKILSELGMVKGYILDADRLDLVDDREKELSK